MSIHRAEPQQPAVLLSSDPMIPMPALTPSALRAAVAQIIPSRLPELLDHLARAATQAQERGTLAPLRTFVNHWGTVVNIERHPTRAARLHECEAIVQDSYVAAERHAACTEIGQILDAAHREITT